MKPGIIKSIFKPGLVLAEEMAEYFSGKVKDTGSFLNAYRYFVEFKFHDQKVCIQIHCSLKYCLVTIKFNQKNNPIICSFGEPAYISFDTPVKPPNIINPIPIYTIGASPQEDRLEVIYKFLANKNNYKDIENLHLEKGEHFAMYSDAFESKYIHVDVESIRRRLTIVTSIIERMSDTSTTQVFDPCVYQMIPGETIEEEQDEQPDSSIHAFGGTCKKDMPVCCNCNSPLHLIATIDLDDPDLDFEKKHCGYIYIVCCLNCDSYREPIFIKYSTKAIEVLEQATGQSFGEFPKILPKRKMLLKPTGEQSSSEEHSEIKHQIGGIPTWIQQPEYVSCPKCDKDMSFLAQLSTDDELNIQFGDDGCLYCFICEKCKVLATFVQGY